MVNVHGMVCGLRNVESIRSRRGRGTGTLAVQGAAGIGEAEDAAADATPRWRSPATALAERLDIERDRWFLWLPVVYGTGVALYFWLLFEPSLLTALAPIAVAIVLRLVFVHGTLTIAATGMALAITAGFAAAKLRTAWVTSPVLERQINLTDVKGWVELVEPRAGRGQRLTLRVASIRGITAERLPHRVRIRTMAMLPGLVPGDAIRLRATLAPPAIPALPGDHDFARAAFFQRLGGVGYALARPEIDDTAAPPPLMLQVEASIARVRQAISQRVRAALPGEHGAIADALITGERGGISEATNAAYRDSGLFHILSISGLHMTIMAGAIFFTLRFLLSCVPVIALNYPIKKWAAALATIAAFGYLLISGASFATVRSWFMISIMFLAVLLDRPAVALRNVAVSALVIMLVLPESLFDVGFQMSFAAVVALVSAYEAIREREKTRDGDRPFGGVITLLLFLSGIMLTTLIASISVAPFAAFHFHKSQQYAILANLIAIPACNIIVMPAALATLALMPLGLEVLPLSVMGFGIDIMTWCAKAVAALPGAVGRLPAFPGYAFVLMAAGGLWLCLWRTRWRLLGFALIAIGLALSPTLPRPDILIGRDGLVLAARGETGQLNAVATRSAQFELSRWLEHDGDGRTAREVEKAQKGFRCDATGCTATVKGRLLALTRQPAALADDCARAAILILTMPRPASCQAQGPVIDLYDLRDKGTHAIYLEDDRIRIITVADVRGSRPWTAPSHRIALAQRSATAGRGSRLSMFAAPFDLAGDNRTPRPEIEDDDDWPGGR